MEEGTVLSKSKSRWVLVDRSGSVLSALVLFSGAVFLPSVSCSAMNSRAVAGDLGRGF